MSKFRDSALRVIRIKYDLKNLKYIHEATEHYLKVLNMYLAPLSVRKTVEEYLEQFASDIEETQSLLMQAIDEMDQAMYYEDHDGIDDPYEEEEESAEPSATCPSPTSDKE